MKTRKNRLIAMMITVALLVSSLSGIAVFALDDSKIVILFESDVHCGVEGYTKLAALRNEEHAEGNETIVVSSGDYVQGGALGAFSKGQYIIDIMNAVGYDVVTLGNHEFDYTIPVLQSLVEQLNAKVISSNFVCIDDNTPVYDPYTIITLDDTEIAFVGVTTPECMTSTSPKYFKDENGNFLYDFCGDTLYETVQKNVDAAKEEGADYVIALTHLGTEYVTEGWMAQNLAENTTDIDVILDGHSHSTIESDVLSNKNQEDVLISSVGTKFERIGKLVIDQNGKMELTHVICENYSGTDGVVDQKVEEINAQYKTEGDKVFGKSEAHLKIANEEGVRLVRTHETTMGNFCADAFRTVLDADVGFMNGGGVRGEIQPGDVTYNHILSVLPWDNKICVAEATGQMLLDAMEFSVKDFPEEAGGFQQVSGLKFSFDPNIPTPVKVDDLGVYAGIDGLRRVTELFVYDKESQSYLPIDPDKTYTVASTTYYLKENGDGNTIFENAKIINDADMIDTSVITEYLQDYLDGIISEAEYAQTQDRIVIQESFSTETKKYSDVDQDDWFYDTVAQITELGYMEGVSETEFAPNDLINKAMFITTLYRMAGSPVVENTDIELQNVYYGEALAWARENGIFAGTDLFAADDTISREDMALSLFRYKIYQGMDAVTQQDSLGGFIDAEQINEYAVSAMNWAVYAGIFEGNGDGTLTPQGNSTRAEAAAVLTRLK